MGFQQQKDLEPNYTLEMSSILWVIFFNENWIEVHPYTHQRTKKCAGIYSNNYILKWDRELMLGISNVFKLALV